MAPVYVTPNSPLYGIICMQHRLCNAAIFRRCPNTDVLYGQFAAFFMLIVSSFFYSRSMSCEEGLTQSQWASTQSLPPPHLWKKL